MPSHRSVIAEWLEPALSNSGVLGSNPARAMLYPY